MGEFQEIVQTSIDEYNQVNKAQLSLVIFRYVLEHLSKICRVLKSPGGNALLVGVGGSGRQSLTRLGGYMAGMTTFQPEISKAYGVTEWREDIKLVLKGAGAQGKARFRNISPKKILIFGNKILNLGQENYFLDNRLSDQGRSLPRRH